MGMGLPIYMMASHLMVVGNRGGRTEYLDADTNMVERCATDWNNDLSSGPVLKSLITVAVKARSLSPNAAGHETLLHAGPCSYLSAKRVRLQFVGVSMRRQLNGLSDLAA